MLERDYNKLKRLLLLVPLLTVLATVLIQWGTLSANSANIQKGMDQQRLETDKRFEKIEKEKADADVVETKFNTVDWKLDLILQNLNIPYKPSPTKKSSK